MSIVPRSVSCPFCGNPFILLVKIEGSETKFGIIHEIKGCIMRRFNVTFSSLDALADALSMRMGVRVTCKDCISAKREEGDPSLCYCNTPLSEYYGKMVDPGRDACITFYGRCPN